MIDLSIIIPVYNTELNILKNSIENINKAITDISFEIVVIDDGSDEYIGEFFSQAIENVNYYRQENEGVSAARNKGIELSKGQYITFSDSDDELIFENIDIEIMKDLEDLYIFDYYTNKAYINVFEKSKVGKIDVVEQTLIDTKLNSIWAKIYKTSKIKDLRFNTNMVSGEDAVFFIEFLDKINSVRYIKKPLYYYTYEEATYIRRAQKFSIKVLQNIKDIIEIKSKYAIKYNFSQFIGKIQEIYTRNYFNTVSYILRERKLNLDEVEHIENFTSNLINSNNRGHNLRLNLLKKKKFSKIKLIDKVRLFYRKVKK